MKIAIIGAGNVGTSLARKWSQHEITFGVRNPSKYEQLNKEFRVMTVDEAVVENDILILTIPGNSVPDFLSSHNLENKIIIDAANYFAPELSMAVFQRQYPSTHFVKAFNTIGYNIMQNPVFGALEATLLICGDSEKALDIAMELGKAAGFDVVLAGDSSMAGDLENFARLWIKLSRKIGRDFAFKMIKR